MNAADYSLLIHDIEGQIDKHIDHNESLQPPTSTSSAQKRRRVTGETSFSISTGPLDMTASSPSTATKLRLTVMHDELKLKNEQLEDEVKSLRDDMEREKQRFGRQMTFLDQENADLRKALGREKEKYYEDKTQWQAKVRALEMQVESAKKNASAFAPAPASVPRSSGNQHSSAMIEWDREMEALEDQIKMKSLEYEKVKNANMKLEERVGVLEQEVMKANMKSREGTGDDMSELKDLRSRCSVLETSLRRKNRELDRCEEKLQNQQLLEEEVAKWTAKAKSLQKQADELPVLEAKYKCILEERGDWVETFHDVVNGSISDVSDSMQVDKPVSSTTTSTSRNASTVTPTAAMRILSESQKKCALLASSLGSAEALVKSLRREAIDTEQRMNDAQTQANDAQYLQEQAERKSKLHQQQAKIFESEVLSLRKLLKSFDAEFSLGKPSESSLVALKEREIKDLRDQLDESRGAYKTLHEEVRVMNTSKEEQSSELNGLKSELAAMRESNVELKRQLQDAQPALETECYDFDTSTTKVLHIVDNPFSLARQEKAAEETKGQARETISIPTNAENVRVPPQEQGSTVTPSTAVTEPTVPVDTSMALSAPANAATTQSAGASSGTSSEKIDVTAGGVDSSKLNQRLKEMFKERISSFREAVYLLTGYKIDLQSADSSGGYSRLRLRSMYAENPDDAFLFQWKGGSLELLDTPFAEKLDPKHFSYLTTCHSVPAFLSAITIELFENQTFMG